MAVRSLLDLKSPEEISFLEVVTFWELSNYPSPCGVYPTYISPNRVYAAWVNETMGRVALMWERHSGRIMQIDKAALYEFISKLGGWI